MRFRFPTSFWPALFLVLAMPACAGHAETTNHSGAQVATDSGNADAGTGNEDAGSEAAANDDAGNADASSGNDDAGSEASGNDDAGNPDAARPVTTPFAFPLSTSSRWIVDANGVRVKLASVSWYGTESTDFVVAGLQLQDVNAIAARIKGLGFNSVRLPWSNQMVEENPVVGASLLAANPALVGLHALDVFDAVITALANQGILVILDNHVSVAGWCCQVGDGNDLWYNAQYPETSWLADWQTLASRYAHQPNVVGADLRNELRGPAAWGGGNPSYDWGAAAVRGGNAVLAVNPNLLVIVEGINFSNDLTGPYTTPVTLATPNRVVYSPHDYAFDHGGLTSCADLNTTLGDDWGYLIGQNHPYTAPVWVGEFGTCDTADTCVSSSSPADNGFWFGCLAQYLAGPSSGDFDWSYWAINGTEASGATRTLGAPETYGVLDPTWTMPASAALAGVLASMQPATQGP